MSPVQFTVPIFLLKYQEETVNPLHTEQKSHSFYRY